MLRFVSIVVAALVLAGASPLPVPKPSVPSAGPSQQPSNQTSQQKPDQDERGTANSPAVVKVLPSEKSKDDLAREERKDEADRRLVELTGDLARYTEWLFGATLALGFITMGLVVVGFLQVRDAKESIAAAVKSAAAAEKAANAAESQTAIVANQTDTIQKQHAVGRLEFLATHRPRLRVRHVSVVTAALIGHPTIFFSHGAEIKGGLAVVNVGGTKATIIESRYRIYFSKDGLPASAPYDTTFHNLLMPGQVLDIGESCATAIVDEISMEPPPPGIDAELRAI